MSLHFPLGNFRMRIKELFMLFSKQMSSFLDLCAFEKKFILANHLINPPEFFFLHRFQRQTWQHVKQDKHACRYHGNVA